MREIIADRESNIWVGTTYAPIWIGGSLGVAVIERVRIPDSGFRRHLTGC